MIKIYKNWGVREIFGFIITLLSVKYVILKYTPFCLPSGKAAVLTNSRIHPSPALPGARSRWLLQSSSKRHSPLDALNLGHPRFSLNQGDGLGEELKMKNRWN
jgi:hypothetical protein